MHKRVVAWMPIADRPPTPTIRSFPVSGHGPVVGLGWALTEVDHPRDPDAALAGLPAGRRSARPARRHAASSPPQRAAAPHVQRLVVGTDLTAGRARRSGDD